MSKSVFFSFHYDGDHTRAQLVRNMNKFNAQEELAPQRWEDVKAGGRNAVVRWINKEMTGKDAVVVLVGADTGSRPWVLYEIKKAWNDRIPLVGVRIHGLSAFGRTSHQGTNPFSRVRLSDGSLLSTHVYLHAPAGSDSKARYNDTAARIESWTSGATKRGVYGPSA